MARPYGHWGTFGGTRVHEGSLVGSVQCYGPPGTKEVTGDLKMTKEVTGVLINLPVKNTG